MTGNEITDMEATNSSWMYFVTGSLVTYLAIRFLNHQNKNENTNDGDDDSDDGDPVPTASTSSKNNSKEWGPRDAPYKMVLVVNTSLSMGKGKIAAQCSHAAVGCYKRSRKQCPDALQTWERTGCAKIAVKCPTEEEMYQIYEAAHAKGIPLYLVEDAGRTQIAAGSRTVLGLGPAPVSVFEGVTSHLKLM